MSDDSTPETTPEEKRVIIAHDCAMEILSLPMEERRSVIDAIERLVGLETAPPTNIFDAFLALAHAHAPSPETLGR